MTPFFNFTQPEIARNLARFRVRTLDAARRKAARHGGKGAFYPWETGCSGEEETEAWLRLPTHQVHIVADVAYALQSYVDATGDLDFYREGGAEVLIETARFWQSRAEPAGEKLSIPDAGGPDEFHVVGRDSAFVNNMAAHNLRLGARAVGWLREHSPETLARILQRSGATEDEVERFADTASRIHTMQREDGLFEQCRGFFGLRDEILHAHGGAVYETQTVKQADVIMLLMLLPDAWSRDAWRVNWKYYEPRCVHLSSLSHGAHGIVAAEMGLHEDAARYIGASLDMDLNDAMANTAGGAHMAANGLNWLAVVRGYGGCRPSGERFLVAPHLPPGWQRLRFRLKWRGADFDVDATPQEVAVRNRPGAAVLPVTLVGEDLELAPGQSATRPAV
jgi:kojibiose phosphorylase